MPHTLDQILPSLQALGSLGYWLVGLASTLEAFFVTGVVVPGTLVVDAGGMLVQRGLLDFFDLLWFVAIGSVIGSEASYWTGRLAMNRLASLQRIEGSAAFARAQRLFARRGALALVIGRFLGPVAGLMPLVAAIAGMERRRFLIWNIVGSLPYALAHVALGYALGGALGRIGGSFTRAAILAGAVALLILILWGILYSVLRLLPLALAILGAAARGVSEIPAVARWLAGHPGVVGWFAARAARATFTGLPLSLLTLVFLYIGTVWIDSVADFALDAPVVQLDLRLAELVHHFWSPVPLRIATWITALGGWQVVTSLMAAALLWLMLAGRRALAAGLVVSALGNTLTVAVLKRVFDRPRSPLGYFIETSGSFPSGHAAASVAIYGMLVYVLWRTQKLRTETALLMAGLLAFVIGLSRIYLIEHYLSDVLNGWLVGALWLTLGIAVAEWRASRPGGAKAEVRGGWRIAGLAASVALVGLAALNFWRYDPPRNLPPRMQEVRLTAPQDLTRLTGFPTMTDSLLGSPVRAVSLIVLAQDQAALDAAMRAAGWRAAGRPRPAAILGAVVESVDGAEDPTVETVAHFWREQPDDLAFLSPPAGHAATFTARFWATEYIIGTKHLFVGAVGADEAGATVSRDAGNPLEHALPAQGAADLGRIVLPGSTPEGAPLPFAPATVTVLSLP